MTSSASVVSGISSRLIAIVPGLISLILFGINWGIDFTGGTNWELQFEREVPTEDVRAILDENGFQGAVVQSSDGNTIIIRMRELREGSPEKTAIEAALTEQFGTYQELELTTVGPSVGSAVRNRAVVAVALASIGILLYIAYAFRNTNNPILYGLCAIVALLHDAFFVLVSSRSLEGSRCRGGRPVRHRHAHSHRLLGSRHDRRLRPCP